VKYLVFKAGDLPDGVWTDGLVVTSLDPAEGLSDWMKSVYAIVEVDDAVAALVDPEIYPTDDEVYGSRLQLELDALAALCGDPGLAVLWRAGGVVVEPVPSPLGFGDLHAPVPHLYIPDLDIVTAGTFTVGPASAYANWQAAAADSGALTGNLAFVENGNFTSLGTATWAVNLNGFRLTITTNSPSLGNPTLGHLWTHNGANYGQVFTLSGAGTLEVGGLRADQTAFRNDPSRGPWRVQGAGAYTLLFHDNLYNARLFRSRGLTVGNANCTALIWNNILINGRPNAANNGAEAFLIAPVSAASRLENNATFGFREGFSTSAALTYQACLAYACTTFAGGPGTTFSGPAGVVGITCASDDAGALSLVGAGSRANLGGVAFGPQFLSELWTNPDFLKLVDPPLLPYSLGRIGAPPLIAGNTAGIRPAVPRPGPGGTSSLGADQNNNSVRRNGSSVSF
jgi:hypothetical protein